MRKYIISFSLLLIAGASALAQETTTRFGALTVNDDKMLLFKGHPLNPPVGGNNSLDVGKPNQIGATDVALITNNGGTTCPFLYYLVTVSASGAKSSPLFGTCAEVTTVKRTGDSLSVYMPGFEGPFESERKQLRASREKHVFIFRAGVVTENGKRVK
jgi:hypothetical protein